MFTIAGLLDRRILRRLPLVTSSAASPVAVAAPVGAVVTGSLATTSDPLVVTACTPAARTAGGDTTLLGL